MARPGYRRQDHGRGLRRLRPSLLQRQAGVLFRVVAEETPRSRGVNGALETWVAGDTFVRQATRLVLTIASALLVLGISAHVLRIREFRDALALVAKRGGSGA